MRGSTEAKKNKAVARQNIEWEAEKEGKKMPSNPFFVCYSSVINGSKNWATISAMSMTELVQGRIDERNQVLRGLNEDFGGISLQNL